MIRDPGLFVELMPSSCIPRLAEGVADRDVPVLLRLTDFAVTSKQEHAC
jgi:hypothetical protein